MKKYIFILGCLLCALAAWRFGWLGALPAFGLLLAWVYHETLKRQQPRFMHGGHVREILRRRHSDVLQVGAAGVHAWALYRDRYVSLWNGDGKQLWERPLESGTQALLPSPQGGLWLALGQELVLWDQQGQSRARLAFDPPPFQQSYQLLHDPTAKSLLLHTPWFTQVASADLSQMGQRLPYQEVDHYTKYAALSHNGQSLLVAGARLLEEEAKAEARWSLWAKQDGSWKVAWRHQESSSSSSHLRGVQFAAAAGLAVLEIYKEGYEFRVIDTEGALHWRRDGEKPVLNHDASLLLWENPYEGVTLSRVHGHEKIWAKKFEEYVRAKWFDEHGRIWIQNGRMLNAYTPDGQAAWSGHWVDDPFVFAPFAGGLSLIAARQDRLGLLRLA